VGPARLARHAPRPDAGRDQLSDLSGLILLRNARAGPGLLDVAVEGERVARVLPAGQAPPAAQEVDLQGRVLMPALVNGHDHLDFSTFPALGHPPYASAYAWAADVDSGRGDPRVREALQVPLPERLWLGGVRNVLGGVAAVAHHGPWHRSLGNGFPVKVLERYQFAHSPGLTPELRRTYRSTDRRIPWMVHAAEGTDARCRAEVALLAEQNLVRQNTVLVHAVAVSNGDAALLAGRSACVVWCPESNQRLYEATAPVAALRAAGVRVGLGSDSPVSGVRDPLSNLAAARASGQLADEELLEMATVGTAAVARLPVGAVAEGAPADLLAVSSREELLQGCRGAVALLMVGGRALYGVPGLMEPLEADRLRVVVDGQERSLAGPLARRLAARLRAHAALRRLSWTQGLVIQHS
jgi:cytosine/adenosine deaminase-related metal-dependent hydrolase